MRNEMRETYIVGGQIELNGIARNHGYVRSSGWPPLIMLPTHALNHKWNCHDARHSL